MLLSAAVVSFLSFLLSVSTMMSCSTSVNPRKVAILMSSFGWLQGTILKRFVTFGRKNNVNIIVVGAVTRQHQQLHTLTRRSKALKLALSLESTRLIPFLGEYSLFSSSCLRLSFWNKSFFLQVVSMPIFASRSEWCSTFWGPFFPSFPTCLCGGYYYHLISSNERYYHLISSNEPY